MKFRTKEYAIKLERDCDRIEEQGHQGRKKIGKYIYIR